MKACSPIDYFDIGVCMASVYDEDGFLGVQYDAEGSEASNPDATATAGAGGVRDYEVVTPGGLLHRPLDPVADPSGTVDYTQAGLNLFFLEGGRGFCIPLTDPRTVAVLPIVEKGSTLLYADNGSFVRITGSGDNVGQIVLSTTDDGTDQGYSVFYSVGPTGFVEAGPWGKRTFDLSGYRVVSSSGATFSLGLCGGLPGPLASFEAIAELTADIIALDGAIVQLGSEGALGHGPVVRADFLQTACISVLATQIANLTQMVLALATSPAAVGSPPAGAAPLIPGVTAGLATVTPLTSPTLTPIMTWASGTTVVS